MTDIKPMINAWIGIRKDNKISVMIMSKVNTDGFRVVFYFIILSYGIESSLVS
jgi:hypothetical protein